MTTELMRKYLDILNERVSIGPDGQVTGGFKPNIDPNAAPVAPAAPEPAAPPLEGPTPGLRVDRATGMIQYQGREYEATRIMPDGPRPRIPPNNVRVKISCADMGFRCMGTFDAVLYGDRAYVYIR